MDLNCSNEYNNNNNSNNNNYNNTYNNTDNCCIIIIWHLLKQQYKEAK